MHNDAILIVCVSKNTIQYKISVVSKDQEKYKVKIIFFS